MKTVWAVALLVLLPAGLAAKPKEKRKHEPIFKDAPVLFLWTAAAAANAMDMHSTETNLGVGAREINPLMRPLVNNLPGPALYVEQQAYIFGLAYLSHRMRESRHRWIRAVWWVPLAFQFQANIRAYRLNRSSLNLFLATSR